MNRIFSTLLASFAILTNLQADQTNFILLLSDDQSWSGLSVRMHPDIPESQHSYYQTPVLEQLAADGMVFSNAYSPGSACSPTRISLQTGRTPAELHWCKAAPVMEASDGLRLIPPPTRNSIRPDETTIAEVLKTAGYATAHFGKWHLQGRGPEAHGYDVSDGDTGNQDAAPFVDPNPVDIFGMCQRTAEFAAEQKSANRPFFAQLSFHALHYPQNASAANTERYRQMNPRANDKEIGRGALTTDLDTGIGQLLQALDDLDLLETTYVIYMSDNGNGGAKKGLLQGGKGSVNEGGIRVPLIIRGPGVPAGSYCHERVVGFDFFPTFCALAAAEHDVEALAGTDLSDLWHGKSDTLPERGLGFHFPHYQSSPPQSAWFRGEYKLLRDWETGVDSLYQISADPGERENLVPRNPELHQDLAAELDHWLETSEAQIPQPNPDMDPARADSWKPERKSKR